jgi:hypothetical protein
MSMERETGIEPATSSLGSWRSTAELLPLIYEMKMIKQCRQGCSTRWKSSTLTPLNQSGQRI